MSDIDPSLWSNGDPQDYAVDTPEQVQLHFPLAGLGSRFLALLVDLMIQLAANIVLILLVLIAFSIPGTQRHFRGMSDAASKWFAAGLILVYFCLYWGYFSLFEAFRNGQTPGKRVMKIRVIKDSGRQITFFEALARNLLRVVDSMPLYLIGTISILVTKQNKRLGDLVADTIVVHERSDEFASYLPMPTSSFIVAPNQIQWDAPQPAPELHGIGAHNIARLTADDLNLMDSYLARALALPLEARATLASRLLDGLCAKMDVPVPTDTPPERTLEALAYALRGQGVQGVR